MAIPLLQTKLYVPRRRAGLVTRQRLLERLERGVESRLTLVSAPPGFGKTTLLTDWLATRVGSGPAAWLSLDEDDNTPAVFWAYVVAALQTAAPGACVQTSALMQAPQPPPMESVLARLVNELTSAPAGIVLVLDDYHLIDSLDIRSGMTFLLDHLPPQLHIVIASRADPALPLARLRARGELVEVRAADLRFLPEEAASYITDAMGLDVSASDLAALEARTEGWIAALQLVALSLRGRDDVPGFISSFAGDDRYIVDYLVQEVLQRQPEEVRAFLLNTSILDRLTGPLCDALTGGSGGQVLLEALERSNVFVVPLDDRRRWYRYHHLFADVLRMLLTVEQPDQVPELHRRASAWFEQNDDRLEAIRHAFAAKDFPRVADLVEFAIPEMLRTRQEPTVRRWLEALPGDLLRRRAVLNIGYVGALMHSGEFAAAKERLRDAERGLEQATLQDAQGVSDAPVYADKDQFRDLPGMIALYKAGLAQVDGNLPETVRYAKLALERMDEDAPLRGGAMALLGLALWSSGDLEEAHRVYAEGIARVHMGGYVNDSSTIMMADMRIAQGRLREAMGLYQRALRRAEEQGAAAPRGTADLHVGMSELYREVNDLTAARDHLTQSRELGEAAGLPEIRYRSFIAMAGMRRVEEDWDGALDFLEQAERLYSGGFSPNVCPIPAMKARIWIAQGTLTEAVAWSHEYAVSPDDELAYLREYDHLTLARLLLAQARSTLDLSLTHAKPLLERLLVAAEAGGRTGAVIETLALQALAEEAGGDWAAALESLRRALTLAEPEGYVRVFVDEGAPMAELLRGAARRRIAPDYVARLLAAFALRRDAAPVKQPAVDALSERELEVLRLLATDLSGPDIARQLVVSLNTMRTHTKSIYTKLGVNGRRQAISRATELGLL